MKHKCKITVLRQEFYQDLPDEYLADPNVDKCSLFEDGQEFILERDGVRDDFWHMMDGSFNTWDLAQSFESADPRYQLAVVVAASQTTRHL